MSRSYDEVRIYEGIAERTGNRIERAGVRGRSAVCSSLSQLGTASRRLGDGLYYLASAEWPDDAVTLDLNRSWTTLG